MKSLKDVCLCLHFDVNKTLIMSDIAQGRSIGQTVNSLLSESTWGIADFAKPRSERLVSDWQLCHPEPVTESPVTGAVTFGTYLEDHSDISMDQQRTLKRTFTESGGVGEVLRPSFDAVVAALALPEAGNSAVQSALCCSEDHSLPVDYLSQGYYHIIPSFFLAVDYLCDLDIDFRIIFRTYGTDLGNIGTEFNLYCEGKHPVMKPRRLLDGRDPTFPKDLRVKMPLHTGKLMRTAAGKDGVCMAHLINSDCNTQLSYITKGADQVYNVLMNDWFAVGGAAAPSAFTAAISDDYIWWRDNNESDDSGKLLLVEDDSTAIGCQDKKPHLVSVFFDDNIERDRAHIVDVRLSGSFQAVPFAAARGKYLRRVEPYDAIMDNNYYIKEIKEVLREHGVSI